MTPTLRRIIQGFLWSWMSHAKGDLFSIDKNFPCLSRTPVIWCLNNSYTPLTTKVKTPWRVFSESLWGRLLSPYFSHDLYLKRIKMDSTHDILNINMMKKIHICVTESLCPTVKMRHNNLTKIIFNCVFKLCLFLIVCLSKNTMI